MAMAAKKLYLVPDAEEQMRLLFSSNVLTQVRPEYEEDHITSLVLSICAQDLMNPTEVAVLDPDQNKLYVRKLNRIWGSSHRPSRMKQADDGKYRNLIDGNTRTLAGRAIWKEGCSDCRKKYGMEPAGTCYMRHGIRWQARELHGITAVEAIKRQFSANIYNPVKPHMEAHKHFSFYSYLLEEHGGDYPLVKYAREVGRDEQTIRNALAFGRTPKAVQVAVYTGDISYGAALELARLQREKLSTELIVDHWLPRAIHAHKLDEAEEALHQKLRAKQGLPPRTGARLKKGATGHFRSEIDETLAHMRTGQGSLLGDYDLKKESLRTRRKTFQSALKRTFKKAKAYLRHVLDATDHGGLSRDDLDFSSDSAIAEIFDTVELVERLLPYLRQESTDRKAVANAEQMVRDFRDLQAEWIWESLLNASDDEREEIYSQHLACPVPTNEEP